jgi:hypothetical protein
MTTNPKLVDGEGLLSALFDEQSRPSLRWLRARQADRSIPHVRIGRLVFFSPEQVRDALERKLTVKARQ